MVAELQVKRARVPTPEAAPLLALWGRNGVTAEVARTGVLGFGLREMLSSG